MFYGNDFPISLIFGPLLYFAFLNQLNKKLSPLTGLIHFLPFLAVSILFYFLFKENITLYRHFYFITTLLSMFIYPSIVIFSKKRDSQFLNERNLILLEILAILGLAIFFFINIIYINHLSDNFSNIHAQLVIVSIIVVNVGVLTWFLINNKLFPNDENIQFIDQSKEIPPLMTDDELKLIVNRIYQVMNTDKLFLDAHLTLDRLSKQTNFSKEKITYYLNNKLDTDFDDWLASFRINYATELIKANNESLKLEYLANLSGFDSRTTFNKYFKYFVGESPSNYRNKLNK